MLIVPDVDASPEVLAELAWLRGLEAKVRALAAPGKTLTKTALRAALKGKP